MSHRIEVDANALAAVLQALCGPPHHIRELQAMMNPKLFPDNPITLLCREFNAWIQTEGASE